MKTILVIDDDDLVRDALARSLTSSGYKAITAKDGHEALDHCRAAMPDLILTDVIMPDKDGIETILELRKLERRVPIIAISGGGGNEKAMLFLDVAHKLGANKILAKPIRRTELLSAIAELLPVTAGK